MRGIQGLSWRTWATHAAMPLCVVAGAVVLLRAGGDGPAYVVAGGALLCLAGFGARARRLEPVRAPAPRGAWRSG